MKSYQAILKAKGLMTPPQGQGESSQGGKEIYAWDFQGRQEDPYWQAAMAAWREIVSHPYLPGMMRWLQQTDQARYYWLREALPEQFDRLWGTSLTDFRALLNEWVEGHRKACEDYPTTSSAGA